MHSYGLTEYLRKKFNISDTLLENNALAIWEEIQDRGYNLETLYNELEENIDPFLLYEFQAMIRSNVLQPTGERGEQEVCKYHKVIADNLDPGDYIIDFNWDTVMSDALLHSSPFWFPSTGFGINLNALTHLYKKSHLIGSLVSLYHIHGSCVLFKREDREEYLYQGPKTYTYFNTLAALQGDPHFQPGQKELKRLREPSEIEQAKASLGWIFINNIWYQPVFISPSIKKEEYSSSYYRMMRSSIHTKLPSTDQFIFIGYSFPEADFQYLKNLFVKSILKDNVKIMVVNPENHSDSFKNRVNELFGLNTQIDFSCSDFKELIEKFKK